MTTSIESAQSPVVAKPVASPRKVVAPRKMEAYELIGRLITDTLLPRIREAREAGKLELAKPQSKFLTQEQFDRVVALFPAENVRTEEQSAACEVLIQLRAENPMDRPSFTSVGRSLSMAMEFAKAEQRRMLETVLKTLGLPFTEQDQNQDLVAKIAVRRKELARWCLGLAHGINEFYQQIELSAVVPDPVTDGLSLAELLALHGVLNGEYSYRKNELDKLNRGSSRRSHAR